MWTKTVGVAVVGLLCLFTMLIAPSSAETLAEPPTIDLALTGTTVRGAPDDGVTTSDMLEYRLTVTNRGDEALPARGFGLKMFVVVTPDGGNFDIDVVRLSATEFSRLGVCKVGLTDELLCTNARQLNPDESISLRVRYRHPEGVTGSLRFFAELSPEAGAYQEPEGRLNNNGFSGSRYKFAEALVTTTTTRVPPTTISTTSTTRETSTSQTRPTSSTSSTSTSTSLTSTSASSTSTATTTTTTTLNSSQPTTTDPTGATPTSVASSVTSSSNTTETTSGTSSSSRSSSSSSTGSTSSTVATSTTASATLPAEATDDAIAGPRAERVDGAAGVDGADDVDGAAGVDGVAGANVDEDLAEEAAAILSANSRDDGDGPPYRQIVAAIAVLAMLGGLSLGYFIVYDRDPPLVDIRDLNQG